jgi:hypothetical protein
MKHIPSATRYMVILGRTYADGTQQDYEAVNVLQAQYKITPLSAWGTSFTYQGPPVNPNPGVPQGRQTLNGANKYTLTFAKDQTPPVNAFWSITMYEINQGWWFVPNRLNKFTVSPRDNLKYNADGSLTLHFQNESPGQEKEANWLSAPKGDFIPMLRMYWPKERDPSIINGTWKPPAVQRIEGSGGRALP